MLDLPDRFILFDLEYTTWEGAMKRDWSGPGEHREVVEIGAILLEGTPLKKVSCFQAVVKPLVNPEVSDYFVNLTGITKEEVSGGMDFPSALKLFVWWCGDYPIYSFAMINDPRRTDVDVIRENCQLHGIEFPFDWSRFHTVRKTFNDYGYNPEQSGAAPKLFGLKSPGSHRALVDVKGLVIALNALYRKVSA